MHMQPQTNPNNHPHLGNRGGWPARGVSGQKSRLIQLGNTHVAPSKPIIEHITPPLPRVPRSNTLPILFAPAQPRRTRRAPHALNRPSRTTLTPHAPGSGMRSFFSRSPSTYALRPAFASMSRVASAAPPAARTAPRKSGAPLAPSARTNASSGSTSVRDGGRARVYVYSLSRAARSASAHCGALTVFAPAWCACRPCARAEKKILQGHEGQVRSMSERGGARTSTARRSCRPSAPLRPSRRRSRSPRRPRPRRSRCQPPSAPLFTPIRARQRQRQAQHNQSATSVPSTKGSTSATYR